MLPEWWAFLSTFWQTLFYLPAFGNKRTGCFKSDFAGVRTGVCHWRHDWHRFGDAVPHQQSEGRAGGFLLYTVRFIQCAVQHSVHPYRLFSAGKAAAASGRRCGTDGTGQGLSAHYSDCIPFFHDELHIYGFHTERPCTGNSHVWLHCWKFV